jgi:anti-sigma factor RsiW
MEDKRTNSENTHSEVPDLSGADELDDLTAELVAYLDGEQDQQASERTGGKISLDPTIRAEVDALKKTWDLLDYLPRPEPSASFTERTMSRIEPLDQSARTAVSPAPAATATERVRASSGTAPIAAPSSSKRKLAAAAGWLLACGAAVAAGYFIRGFIVERWQDMDPQEKDARILSQADLLQNLRYYRHVDDLKFLTDLDDPELFGEDRVAPTNEGPK